MIRVPLILPLGALLLAAPAFAQFDLSGEWGMRQHEDQPERGPGPDLGDYLGLPINDAARLRADSWDASLMTLPEWQCRPHPADYGTRGPANLRIWRDVDTATQELIAYHTHVSWQAQERTIWMDGRPHPPEWAPHTWQGFSTGKWEGNVLTVTTTHLKESYIRRNGSPRSDMATLTEHWMRHGNVLTLMTVIRDPVYLTEPLVRTTNWEFDPLQELEPYPCEVGEEVQRAEGVVPHHLPGANTFLTEFATKFSLPFDATRGGAATMYPQYALTISNGSAAKPAPAPSVKSPEVEAALRQQLGDGSVHAVKIRGNLYMLVGGGANITASVGDEGILFVDTGTAEMTAKIAAAIKAVSPKPIRYVIDTHMHADHTGGNEAISQLGATIAGGDVARLESNAREGAAIIAHENVLKRMSEPEQGQAAAPFKSLPTDTYLGKKKEFFFNDEAVQLFHQPAAHTDGDSIVFFRRSDVLATGDIFTTTSYPFIDLAHGGSIQGEIDALNRILDLTVPAGKEEGGTMVVPGHGRLCDEADVAYYRDMVTIIRDRIQDLIRKGQTLEQIKAAKPTRDYDARWGLDPHWTPDQFVEAVYKSLTTPLSASR